MNDKLANTYRESQRQLFAENEQMHWEIERLKEKLRYALAVVGMIGFYWRDSEFPGEDGYFCPICDCEEPVHAPDCLKELVLQMEPLEVGEK